ncbi:MAG: alkaline phosphatase D family protein [Acidimicrobiales bacterium]
MNPAPSDRPALIPPAGFRLSRRRFLLAGIGVVAAGCGSSSDDGSASSSVVTPTTSTATTTSTLAPSTSATPTTDAIAIDPPFTLGVASGDPLADRVVLWTRLAPAPDQPSGGMPSGDVNVGWEVARDSSFADVVSSGTTVAEARLAHSVHVDADGLEPGEWYHYRFTVGDHESPVGRTRTAPAADADDYQFALTTCQDPQFGEYGVWADVAADDELHAVVFTGDYIYELAALDFSPAGDGRRQWRSPSPTTLDHFRDRYAQVKEDPSLQAAHAAMAWWVMWDDHEITDNYWREGPGQFDSAGGDFAARRAAAYQAWWEHQPVRLDPPVDGRLDVHRSVPVGSLATLFLIDSRQHADEPPCRDTSQLDIGAPCDDIDDPQRTLLGVDQEEWLLDGLAADDSRWTVLVSPGMFAGLDARAADDSGSAPVRYLESWDGYPTARNRVADALRATDGPLVLSGDYHAAFVLDVGPGFGAEPVCAEFMAAAVSSSPFDDDVRPRNPHVRHFDATNGYTRCTVTPERWLAEFRTVADVWDPATPVTPVATYQVMAGERTATVV